MGRLSHNPVTTHLHSQVLTMPRVFLITGTSSGFGSDYVNHVLSEGDYVVATARDLSKLKFKGATDKNYILVRLDVGDKSSIKDAFDQARKKFGRIDVVVNNAGYGLAGCFEEYTDEQIRKQMEVNFFGLIDVTRVALEELRKNSPSGGVIQQVTSIGGQRGVPFFSAYCASKWAVEGFTEAVSHELKPEWNIYFNIIEPGGFRTDWAGRSMAFADRKLPEYDHLNAKESMTKRHGTQQGDPAKAAVAMYEFACMGKDTPLRIVVGGDAYKAVMNKLDQYRANYTRHEELSTSTDVDGWEG